METLAYLHIALACEETADSGTIPEFDNINLFEGLNLKKLSSIAWIHLLPLMLPLLVLQIATQQIALAALKRGDDSEQVKILQERLTKLGYFKGERTGYFGTQTRDAVLKFQERNELPLNGIADERTQTLIRQKLGITNSSKSPQKPANVNACSKYLEGLRRGNTGDNVKRLQTRLQTLGFFSGKITGFFGPKTEEAVKQFQRSRSLYPYGVVGKTTEQKLGLSGLSTTTVSSKGYVVVVPQEDSTTLNKVLKYAPEARSCASGRGKYIEAGTFNQLEVAESRSKILRSHDLDARVVFRD